MKLSFKHKHVLITGGLGFIGSNLAIALVKKGARVTIVDNLLPEQGGNLFNIAPVQKKIDINYSDIRDALAINQLVQGKDFIFHLARQTDHILSQTDPFPDIDINIRGTAVLLEACKKYNPTVRLIYTGTRGQYGKAVKLPVTEDAPTNPRGIYEITNLTAEKLFQVYHDVHRIPAVMLRLTNIYGPRSHMKHNHYGIVNWFVRQAINGETIQVFGTGDLMRDFLYIDDATDAILRAAITPTAYGEVINIGRDTPETFLELAKLITKLHKGATYVMAPFSKERAAQEPGHFYSDIRKIKRLTGWRPKTSLTSGLKKTFAYYKKYKKFYW